MLRRATRMHEKSERDVVFGKRDVSVSIIDVFANSPR